jgi:hypothetical protein
MNPIGTKYVERVRFFDNERLIASDLQAMDDNARQMRWLHNRSLHQPGVASGFAVTGQKGDSQVSIQPGFAIDALGREMLLTQAVWQSVPPASGDGAGGPAIYDLTVSYPSTLNPETRAGECPGTIPGTVRLEEVPVFCWVPVPAITPQDAALRDDIDKGLRIVLAQAQVLNCQLYLPLSLAPRSDARPSIQPFIYAAQVQPTWTVPPTNPFGIELVPSGPVDTSAAHFRTPPGYFVNLISVPKVNIDGKDLTLDVLVSIYSPDQRSFQVSLLIPNIPIFQAGLTPEEVRKALGTPQWSLEWMGVEA